LLLSDITIDVWFDYNATETRGAVKLIISSAITGKASQPQFTVFFSLVHRVVVQLSTLFYIIISGDSSYMKEDRNSQMQVRTVVSSIEIMEVFRGIRFLNNKSYRNYLELFTPIF
jgi:hypothetical protein